MIRAKTLLASVTILGTALTAFALNTDHDGFVPPDTFGEAGKPPPKFVDTQATPASSATIAKLSKLPPKILASTEAMNRPPTETIEISDADIQPFAPGSSVENARKGSTRTQSAENTSKPDRAKSREAASKRQVASIDKARAKRSFVNRINDAAAAPAVVASGPPLPVRLPDEAQLLRSKYIAHLNQAPANASGELLHDPAVSAQKIRRTLRLKQQQARRLRQLRRRAAQRQQKTIQKAKPNSEEKQTSGPTAEAAIPKPKPSRHSDPFDADRN